TLSTPSGFDELKRNRCRKLRNSLFTKEFSVSTAPEVGRIIDVQNLPSTLNFAFLSMSCRKPKKPCFSPLYREEKHCTYIEGTLRALQLL
ncbi:MULTISPECIES: hypothetical protein, partial [unclassified Pseudomonas]|uniref:hypothetical protein n=1 Tax=unclassified Pseudomonas TaxID=196821 RepID=UPI001A91DC20